MDPYEQRKRLSFAQAEGAAPLPQQLAVGQLSQELRAKLWHVVYQSLKDRRKAGASRWLLGETWRFILYRKHVTRDFKMADEFIDDYEIAATQLKSLFARGNYIEVFDFVQWLIRQSDSPVTGHSVRLVLESSRAAYRVLDDDRTIVPISSERDAETINKAFADLSGAELKGAHAHLLAAAEHLTAGVAGDSVRESIHAVESVARALGGGNTLGGALQTLKKSHGLHPALEKGFSAIYGYTSDAQGIRHPLIDDTVANVDEADAMFMLGACSAFVSYLINRARQRDEAA